MFAADQYSLLDFGDGRKLERFGKLVLDRPSPAADGSARQQPALWKQADFRFHRGSGQTGRWEGSGRLPETWPLVHPWFTLELKANDHGHVGVFPEQDANWQWIAEQVRAAQSEGGEPPQILNLFAYTGASTLVAARAGAKVTHIDAAAGVVKWARRNAELSGLAETPIRWIAEDARKFVAREIKRGRHYDAVILDPPSYGHGPSGQVWKIEEHLPALLSDLAELTRGQPRFVLLSAHSPHWDGGGLAALLQSAWPHAQPQGDSLTLSTAEGRTLHAGCAARFAR